MQTLQDWIEESEQKGRQEGLLEGRRVEAVTIAMRQLQFRIGLIDAETKKLISDLPLEKLEELSLALLKFSDHGDLAEWLREHSGSQETCVKTEENE